MAEKPWCADEKPEEEMMEHHYPRPTEDQNARDQWLNSKQEEKH